MKIKQLIYSRPKYLSALLPFLDKPLIKVILGQRRVGKSFLLLSLIEHLKKK
jgi:uncharacterized protein